MKSTTMPTIVVIIVIIHYLILFSINIAINTKLQMALYCNAIEH